MKAVFEKRKNVSRTAQFLVPTVSFFVSLILSGIMLAAFGSNPFHTFVAMFSGAFGSANGFSETLVKAIPLMLTSLGVALAFKLKFWNIGAEGQLTLGGVAAAGVALFLGGQIKGPSLLILALLAGGLAGAAWAGIPGFLKTRLKVDETLVTLMLNYVAILFSEYLYYGPWRDPKGYGFPGSAQFPENAWLPRIMGRAHIGLYIALAIAAILWILLRRTRWGFETAIIGASPKAARYQGIAVERNIMLTVLLSGALSGLAGACEVTGISHRLQQGLSLGYGYTAIIIAWMSQLNPAVIPFVSLVMAGLLVGGDQVQLMMGLPSAVGTVMQGLILFPMLAGSLFTEYRIKWIKAEKKPACAKGEA